MDPFKRYDTTQTCFDLVNLLLEPVNLVHQTSWYSTFTEKIITAQWNVTKIKYVGQMFPQNNSI